jgi:2'-5' RNA ligase
MLSASFRLHCKQRVPLSRRCATPSPSRGEGPNHVRLARSAFVLRSANEMSRKLTYILRPTLPRRAVVWFPSFANATPIDRFRSQYDPLGNVMPPHVTLVFPFHSRLTLDQLTAHVQKVVRAWPAFPVVMNGVWTAQNEFVGVGAQVGKDALTEMHDRLYRGPLAEFLRPEFEYEPHITLARAIQPNQFDALIRNVTVVTRESYRDLLRSLTIITLENDHDWKRERDIALIW